MAKLKVYSGMPIHFGKQFKVIIAATSRAEVVRVLETVGIRETVSHVGTHWSVTGNQGDIASALAMPRVPLMETEKWSGKYIAVPACRVTT